MMTTMTLLGRAAFRLDGEHLLDIFRVQISHLIGALRARGKRDVQLFRRSQKCLHRFCSVRRRLRGFTSLFSSGMPLLRWWGR